MKAVVVKTLRIFAIDHLQQFQFAKSAPQVGDHNPAVA
jgi:hypothetical protein